MSLDTRLKKLEDVILADPDYEFEEVTIFCVDANLTGVPMFITSLSCFGAVFDRLPGELYEDFKSRVIEESKRHKGKQFKPGRLVLVANGSIMDHGGKGLSWDTDNES